MQSLAVSVRLLAVAPGLQPVRSVFRLFGVFAALVSGRGCQDVAGAGQAGHLVNIHHQLVVRLGLATAAVNLVTTESGLEL